MKIKNELLIHPIPDWDRDLFAAKGALMLYTNLIKTAHLADPDRFGSKRALLTSRYELGYQIAAEMVLARELIQTATPLSEAPGEMDSHLRRHSRFYVTAVHNTDEIVETIKQMGLDLRDLTTPKCVGIWAWGLSNAMVIIRLQQMVLTVEFFNDYVHYHQAAARELKSHGA